MRLDDWPFLDHGCAGAFAYGVIQHATGDGERAAWTVLPPLGGVALRPGPKGWREAYPRRPTAEDDRIAAVLQAAACEMYAAMLDKHLPSLAKRWRARADGEDYSWSTPIRRARFAYYGNHHCDSRLDCDIHDAARARGLSALISASCAFGTVVWDRDRPHPWSEAQHIGEFAVRAAPVLGEPGWEAIERMMQTARTRRPT